MTTHAIPRENDLKEVLAIRLTDAARRIGCTSKFLHQQIKAGRLRAIRLSSRRLPKALSFVEGLPHPARGSFHVSGKRGAVSFDPRMSLFESAMRPVPKGEISVSELVEMVRRPEPCLRQALAAGETKKYSMLKRSLPAASVAGTFSC